MISFVSRRYSHIACKVHYRARRSQIMDPILNQYTCSNIPSLRSTVIHSSHLELGSPKRFLHFIYYNQNSAFISYFSIYAIPLQPSLFDHLCNMWVVYASWSSTLRVFTQSPAISFPLRTSTYYPNKFQSYSTYDTILRPTIPLNFNSTSTYEHITVVLDLRHDSPPCDPMKFQ
jgi:hypothetical protein